MKKFGLIYKISLAILGAAIVDGYMGHKAKDTRTVPKDAKLKKNAGR